MSKDKAYHGTGFRLRNGIGMTRVDGEGNQLIMIYNKWGDEHNHVECAVESMDRMFRFFRDKKVVGESCEQDVERDREVLHRLLREYLDTR